MRHLSRRAISLTDCQAAPNTHPHRQKLFCTNSPHIPSSKFSSVCVGQSSDRITLSNSLTDFCSVSFSDIVPCRKATSAYTYPPIARISSAMSSSKNMSSHLPPQTHHHQHPLRNTFFYQCCTHLFCLCSMTTI
jgi:hypothetical protein